MGNAGGCWANALALTHSMAMLVDREILIAHALRKQDRPNPARPRRTNSRFRARSNELSPYCRCIERGRKTIAVIRQVFAFLTCWARWTAFLRALARGPLRENPHENPKPRETSLA